MIQFKMNPQDLMQFNKHYVKKHGAFLQKYIQWIILLVLVGILSFQVYKTADGWASYFIVVCFAAIMVLLQTYIPKFFARKAMLAFLRKNPSLIGERTYEFDQEQLFVKVDGTTSNYPFASFMRLEEDKFSYYAYINEITAIIIPKRLMQLEEAKDLIEKIKAQLA